MQEKSKPIRRKNTLAAGRPSKAKKAGVIAAMAVASALSVSICYTQLGEKDWLYSSVLLVVIIGLIGFSALEPKVAAGPPVVAPASHRLSRRTLVAGFLILVMIPLTIWVGITYFGDRRYYIVSMAIVVYTMIPFFMSFEGRKPQARELVVIAVLAAIAVAGRAAFFMLPQFKPVVAIVIIAGVCFGGEAGFLVGAVTGFVSNFFFGQGPWTPWQMFAFGIIGFLAGIFFQRGWLKTDKLPLCIFGGITTLCIYGPIMNSASLFMWSSTLSWPALLSMFATGLPFDLVHAVATVFFLSIFSQPFIEKLERIKKKYGLLEGE